MPRFDLSLPDLQSYLPEIREPDDFDEFWSGTIAEARSVGGEVAITAVETGLTQVDVFDVTFPGYGGEPIKAWLTAPHGAAGPPPATPTWSWTPVVRAAPGDPGARQRTRTAPARRLPAS